MSADNKVNDPDSLLKKAVIQLRDAGIPISSNIDPHVKINTRAKKRFGMCIMKNGSYTIELSSVMLTSPEDSCMQTLCHELIHTCKGCGNHGRTFKRYADILNRRYGYNIQRTNSAEEMGIPEPEIRKSANYILKCQKCGAEIVRSRYSNVIARPSHYRCRCGGSLKRIK